MHRFRLPISHDQTELASLSRSGKAGAEEKETHIDEGTAICLAEGADFRVLVYTIDCVLTSLCTLFPTETQRRRNTGDHKVLRAQKHLMQMWKTSI